MTTTQTQLKQSKIINLIDGGQIVVNINSHNFGIDVRAMLYSKGIADSTSVGDMTLLADTTYTHDDSTMAVIKFDALVLGLSQS